MFAFSLICAFWLPFCRLVAPFGNPFAPLGPPFGPLGPPFGPPGTPSWVSEGLLGRPWAPLWGPLAALTLLYAHLGGPLPQWTPLGPPRASFWIDFGSNLSQCLSIFGAISHIFEDLCGHVFQFSLTSFLALHFFAHIYDDAAWTSQGIILDRFWLKFQQMFDYVAMFSKFRYRAF